MKGARPAPPDAIVGVVAKRGRFMVAEPFFEQGGAKLALGRDARVRVDDLVLVQGGRPGPKRGGGARVLRHLGRPDVAADVIEALMLDRGLRRGFDPAVEHEARAARDRGEAVGDQAGGRRDLTALPTFTIDPATARDFDDALSAQRLGEGHARVWVHIADVSAFVVPGSQVDGEALRRATSVYVPGKVEPMLPEALSNDACSLVPGQERLAVTVEMEVRGEEVVRTTFHRSRIRSDRRLTYEKVDAIFAGRARAEEPWGEPLAVARDVAGALEARRARTRALELSSSEPEFTFDAAGHVASSAQRAQTESHRLVEHLMIVANEQVATLLAERGVPALHRVHEQPDPTAAERLVDQLDSLGLPTPPLPEAMSPSQAADVVADASRLVEREVRRHEGRGRAGLTTLVLRALKQAHYAPQSLGHAGLGLTRYCHFTSPIRRYPDLVCHRALLSAVGGGEAPPDRGAMPETGAWTSARERDAMALERAADRVARSFLLERELFGLTSPEVAGSGGRGLTSPEVAGSGDRGLTSPEVAGSGDRRARHGFDREFDGEIIGLISAGAFVSFGDGHEGLLPVRRLRGDWWELNEQGTILHGTRSERTIRLGDRVRVMVERVEAPRGRVDLLPVEV
ncbi:MAG: RNB domain-containing ribonuclease [Solirubrobacteraceae bacterium MAG38_C4-C5]|nr:RNB domain-containing ribonuclease [Candidatus Siliceabacter maunaloa]